MSVDPEIVQTLFFKLIELSPADRDEALSRECGQDEVLKRRVSALLIAHDDPDSLLKESPPAFEATVLTGTDQSEQEEQPSHSDVDGAAQTPTQIGSVVGQGQVIAERYTLTEQIGEGGMGEVWVAKQSEPVKRRVALKLIKTGMDSRTVLKRFEQERQALAMMDHPNIASVLDGGLTPTGQPFFVMELVNGLSLTKFCDETKLTPRERLELFLPICHAVQHAHQKGIVHRDLKPANILVTMVDGKPVPKVIDFGVAKATTGKLIEETMSTQFGSVVGTLEYMSPEQAGFSGTDIDTRADIYSLGVILYELLTGLRPIDAQRLKEAAMTEMIRIIREEDPSKPSTRLSTDAALPSLAAVRGTDPRRLTALLKGELDWIVMKCLEKQRDRRYETANSLARDIERHLNDEAIEARPPSTGYRLGKFFRKHRAAFVSGILVSVSLILGFGVSLWQAIRATQAENLAMQRFESEQSARQTAEEAQARETRQRDLAMEAKRVAERREYQAEMILVRNNWEQNNLTGFHELLNAQRPAEGEPDRRGFEWYYWNNRVRRGVKDLGNHDGFGQVASVEFSPDGSLLASGSGESSGQGLARIWDTATGKMVRELPLHQYRIHRVAFSPDGKSLATASGDHADGGMVKVWDLETGKELFHRDFKNSVNSVSFSPELDGAKLVAGSTVLYGKWGELKAWNWKTGEELFSRETENRGYRGAIFTPDGKGIASGSHENGVPGSRIEIWTLDDPENEPEILEVNAEYVFRLAYRPIDREEQKTDDDLPQPVLAAAVGHWSGFPGVVKQWDATGRELPLQLIGHESRIVDVCYSHDGKRIASACFDNTVKIWEAETGIELATLRGHTESAWSVAFSPDDEHLASGSGESKIKLWNADAQQSLLTEQQEKGFQCVTYNSDGTLVATAGDDGCARIWDARSAREIFSVAEPPTADGESIKMHSVAFSPDDKLLATGSGIGTSTGFGLPPIPGDVRVWDMATRQVVHHFKGHTAKVCTVKFSPDGKQLVSVSGGWGELGEIKIWDLDTGEEVDLGLEGHIGHLWPVTFSPDGQILAWARLDFPEDVADTLAARRAIEEGRARSVIVIWDLKQKRIIRELVGHRDGVIELAFHPKVPQLATASTDETIKIWNLETGEAIRTLKGHTHRVHGVAYSPDGRQLVSCSADGTGKLWDLELGHELLTFEEHANFIWSIAFSPDGDHIASAGGDRILRIWDGTRDDTP